MQIPNNEQILNEKQWPSFKHEESLKEQPLQKTSPFAALKMTERNQNPNFVLRVLRLGTWRLFIIWNLLFGISPVFFICFEFRISCPEFRALDLGAYLLFGICRLGFLPHSSSVSHFVLRIFQL